MVKCLALLSGLSLAGCGGSVPEPDSTELPPSLACGDGLEVVDNVCVPQPFSILPVSAHLPFVAGTRVTVSQGAHGPFSHREPNSLHALDFTVDEGTTVVAARAGIVLDFRSDSDTGCGDISCINDANLISIDHGDGTIATYAHLKQNGVLVDRFEVVAAGQPIGLSGNTGFSTGPHLHFAISDVFYDSIPTTFEECDGCIPNASIEYESSNQESPAGDVEPSLCPQDSFAFAGVILEQAPPCTVATLDTEYPVSGYTIDSNIQRIAAFHTDDSFEYVMVDCVEVVDGAFSFDLEFWSGFIGEAGVAGLNLSSASGENCEVYAGGRSAVVYFQ